MKSGRKILYCVTHLILFLGLAVCGFISIGSALFNQNHFCEYGEWKIIKEATCLEDGVEMRICKTDSSHSEQRLISPKGHLIVAHAAQSPTCTEVGWKTYEVCGRDSCDYTTYEEISANGHNFADGVCGTCFDFDPDYTASVGLEYTLSDDGICYSVTGIGTCTDTDVVIPSIYKNLPVSTIGYKAFWNCDSLTSVEIGDSVTSIGEEAFYSCTSLTSVVIPDSVTSIGSSAFLGCTSLTSVVIGDSVTSIGGSAFYNCSSLKSVEIGKLVTSIASHSFYNCSALTSVVIGDSVTSISDSAFRDCTSLTNVVIGDSVTSIDSSAFYGCSSLTNVVIPDSVTEIGNYAFYNCSALTSVEIGDSVTEIGNYAFYWCTSLTSVVIGDSVTSIGNYAFVDCTSLTSVVIPDSVTSIGSNAFWGCYSLTSVYYKGTAEEWAEISVGSSNTSLTNATRYYYSETEPTDEGNYWHYDENGEIVVW